MTTQPRRQIKVIERGQTVAQQPFAELMSDDQQFADVAGFVAIESGILPASAFIAVSLPTRVVRAIIRA